MAPLLHLPAERVGVDQLHLIYLNFFKHLFKYTVHENLPETKKVIIRDYLKAQSFYSYDAASVDEDPVKRWIGREVKRFLAEAQVHLPFLLRTAAAPIDLLPNSVEDFVDEDGVHEEMDVDDDEYEPTPAEIEAESEQEPLMMANAERWDRFLSFVLDVQSPWISDTDEYREQRAVSYFNHSMACSRDLLELKPTLQSWVPHISCFVVPQQILLLGDPSRRAADACESFGAVVKHIIKRLTCRRRTRGAEAPEAVSAQHHHHRNGKTWRQSFSRGYIEQTFRRVCVRESLLHGEGNAPFLQRADWKLLRKGIKTEHVRQAKEVPPSVRSMMAAEVDV